MIKHMVTPIDKHIAEYGVDERKSCGSIRVKLNMASGASKHTMFGVRKFGYDVAVQLAYAQLDIWLREDSELMRLRFMQQKRKDAISVPLQQARTFVDETIYRNNWREVDDYFGRGKMWMPVQIL